MNSKRVFYVEYTTSPLFAETLTARGDVTLERIENETARADAAAVLMGAHAYQIGAARAEVAPHWQVTEALLADTPDLLAVSSNGAGYDTIDLAACTRAGVLAVNQAGGNREAVAEYALGMMLALSKRIVEADRKMRRGAPIEHNKYAGHDISGRTVGIVGLGNTGGRVAELCHGLFAMTVLAYDPYLDAATMAARGAEKVTLEDLLARSDFVLLNCPRTAETRGMIGAGEFALMQSHAYFITTARGGIHDEAALAAVLERRGIAGAALDVWDPEPPAPDHPLLGFDTVIASPHTAGVTHEALTTMARMAAEQLLAILDGQRPPRLLNPEAWPDYVRRYQRVMGQAVAA